MPPFQNSLQSYSDQTVWYWHKDSRWNGSESLEMDSTVLHIYSELTKVPSPSHGKETTPEHMVPAGRAPVRKSMKLDPNLTSYSKVNSKRIKDLQVRAKATKLRRKYKTSVTLD